VKGKLERIGEGKLPINEESNRARYAVVLIIIAIQILLIK
jgi:hypothetical protein